MKIHILVSVLILNSATDINFDFEKCHVISVQDDTTQIVEDKWITSLDPYLDTLIYSELSTWEFRSIKMDSLVAYAKKNFGDTSLASAFIIHKRGVLEHWRGLNGQNSAFSSAIGLYKKALKLRIYINTYQDGDLFKEIINGYSMISICYFHLGNENQSLDFTLKGINLLDKLKLKDSLIEDFCYLNTQAARTYTSIGDFDQALKHYANIINSTVNEHSNDELMQINEWKMRAYIETGELHANNLYNPKLGLQNLKIGEKMLNTFFSNNKEDFLGGFFHKKGNAFFRMELFDSACYYFQKAVEVNLIRKDKEALADNMMNLAVVYNKISLLDSASYYLAKANDLYTEMGLKTQLYGIYDNFGDLAFKRGDYFKSIEYYNRAMTYINKEFIPNSIYSNPILLQNAIANKTELVNSLSSKAYTFLFLYRNIGENKYLNAAYQTFQLTDQVIGLWRQEFHAEASRMSLAKNCKPIYEGAIETCYLLYNLNQQDSLLNKAFEYSEKSKAIVLLDAVRKTNASSSVDPQLIRTEREINLKVNYFEKQAAIQEQDKNKKAAYNVYDSLLYHRRQRQVVIEQIKEETPEYYSLIFEQSTTTPQKLRSFLREDQSLIEYFVGDSSLYTFVISRENTLFLRNNNPDSVKLWTHQMVHNVQQKDQNFILPSKKLYDQLVLSIKEKIPLSYQLVLVPDEVLSLINFEMLVTEFSHSDRIYFPSFKNYLLYDHQVSYAFSATTLVEAHKKTKTRDRTFLGIAPLFDKGFTVDGTFFDKLGENIDEVEQLSAQYKNLILVKEKANKEAFFEFAPEYSIIHFATHAKANNSNGDLSFIAFGSNETDVLYAKDLYALDLNADIVVLSACQTSLGSLNRGEGIISLARGFIYAGASSVVTSLWNVREGTNKSIIGEFYQGLENGLPKDKALRESKINFLNSISRENQELAHPYYWATLVCMGDTAPYRKNSSSKLLLFLLLALILVPASFILYKKIL